MVSPDDTPDYEIIAARLDRLRSVPDEVLADTVMRDGLCMWLAPPAEVPDWDECAPSDRALATWLCAGCPVIDHCLELDLREYGQATTGVWGALPEDDRRALEPRWRRRRDRTSTEDQEGGREP